MAKNLGTSSATSTAPTERVFSGEAHLRRVRAAGRALPAASFLLVLLSLPLGLGSFGEFVIIIGFIYALIAIGLHMLVHWAGQVSFGHVAFVGIGAFVTARLATDGHPVWLSLGAGTLSCLAAGLLVGIPALRIRGFYLAILTFAFGYAADRWLFQKTWLTGTLYVGNAVPRPKVLGTDFSDAHMYLFILAWLVFVIVGLSRLRRTRVGRALIALRHSEDLAVSLGINVAAYKVSAFMVSSAIAGLGGGLWAYAIGIVDPSTFPIGLSMIFVTMVVMGGPGPIWGSAVFAFSFGALPALLGGRIAEWLDLIGPIGLIFVVLQYPGGQNQAFRETARMAQAVAARFRRGKPPSVAPRMLTALESGPELPPSPTRPARSEKLHVSSKGAPVLEIKRLSVSFGGLQALDGVSLVARQGLVTGLIGPNGAGKSTLLNCVSGLLRPESGEVWVFGKLVSAIPPHRRAQMGMGRTFQQMALCPDQSVTENLLIAQHRTAPYRAVAGVLGLRGVSSAERRLKSRADQMLELFDLHPFAHAPIRDLSLGTAKRVELACVLVCDPPLLLLDEPTAGLDPKETGRLVRVLETIRRDRSLSIVLVTHNMRLVMGMADHIHVLNFGQILASGSPTAIRRNAAVVDAYLGAGADQP